MLVNKKINELFISLQLGIRTYQQDVGIGFETGNTSNRILYLNLFLWFGTHDISRNENLSDILLFTGVHSIPFFRQGASNKQNINKILDHSPNEKMSMARRASVPILGQRLLMSSSGRTVLLFKLFFFLSTLIVQSEQQVNLTMIPSGTEQVIEAGSTLSITCVSNRSPVIDNNRFSWTVPKNGITKLEVITTLIHAKSCI